MMKLRTKSPLTRRCMRVRSELKKKNQGKLRLSVFRSSKNISAQVIDDSRGFTLAAASTCEKDLGLSGKLTKESAARVGALVAERAKAVGISVVYFDRGPNRFHGRVKALADAARGAGLEF